MRIHRQFIKSITLSAVLFTGFAVSGIAQDSTHVVNPETKAPVILTTTPSDGEMNVDLNSVIEITFTTEMDKTTLDASTLLLRAASADSMPKMQGMQGMHDEKMDDHMKYRSAMKDSGNSRHSDKGAVNGTISYSEKVAVFTPNNELKKGTLYTFTVTSGVKSSEKKTLENEYTWSFTTTGTPDSTNSTYSYEQQGAQNSMDRYGMEKYGMDRDEYTEGTMDTTLMGTTSMIELGKAGHYVILAKTSVNNESESSITGQVGEGDGTDKINKEKVFTDSVRQRTSGQVVVWKSNESDTTSADVSDAIEDMMFAYSNASMQTGGHDSTGQMNEGLNDSVLTSGIHVWSDSLHIMSDVTLSGGENDVWLFKVGNDLTVDENTMFTLTGGARAENIFWYVEGDVTIGRNAHFEGIILSVNEITLEKGATLNGRMFSQTSINLDDNTVTEPVTMTGQTTSTNR